MTNKYIYELLLRSVDGYNWQKTRDTIIDSIPKLVTVSLRSLEIIKEIDALNKYLL